MTRDIRGFHWISHRTCHMSHVILPVFAMGDGSDSSDEEILALCLLYRRARRRNCSRRSIWCRDHYLLRPERGEFTRTFRYLMDNPDRELFFNYTRMSYETYAELKQLVLPHLQPIGTNYREAISGEEKLILTLR